MCLAQGHNAVMLVRLKPATHRSQVKHSTTEPLPLTPSMLFFVGNQVNNNLDNNFNKARVFYDKGQFHVKYLTVLLCCLLMLLASDVWPSPWRKKNKTFIFENLQQKFWL